MADSKSMTIETKTGRPEDELLLRCARVSRYPEGDRRIMTLLREPLDWDYLIRAAGEHGVMPLLYWHLASGFEDLIPESILGRLRDAFHANRLRNLLMAGELLKLYGLFERNGISAVPYKGPTLSAAVYKNLALRQCGDLDVLVYRSDVLKAKELLLSRGYDPVPWLTYKKLTPAQEAAFLRFEREYAFANDDIDVSVELQWEIAPRYFSFSLGLESLRVRLQRVSLGRDAVPTLAPEDLLLVLCVHGSKHFWERLIWICDVAEMVNVHREMEWEPLMEQAAALGSTRMLLLGLSLAHELLEADLPAEVLQMAQADPWVGRLAGEVYEGLFRKSDGARGLLNGSAFYPFHYKMRERRRDRVRYALRKAMAPNESDWMERPLPEKLFFLYYTLRPLRLAAKYGQRLSRRVSR